MEKTDKKTMEEILTRVKRIEKILSEDEPKKISESEIKKQSDFWKYSIYSINKDAGFAEGRRKLYNNLYLKDLTRTEFRLALNLAIKLFGKNPEIDMKKIVLEASSVDYASEEDG